MRVILKLLVIILLGCLIRIEPSMAQKEKETVKKGRSLLKKFKSFAEPSKKEPTSQKKVVEAPQQNSSTVSSIKLTPPDVNEQINFASEAYSSNSYAQARFYVQQAIIGIELEIGYKILESMPETMLAIAADKTQDEVFSAGAGFMGMIVSRQFPQDVGTTKASVVNNSALFANMQLAMSSYAMTSSDDQSKIIQYKGYKTLLEAEEYAGFKMSIPFGQSSLFVLDCHPCESENQLLEAADGFDIDKYSKLLGEK
jgi:hypothetical protein